MAPELTTEQQELVNEVTRKREHADRTVHTQFRKRCDHLYGLYRAYHDLKGDMAQRTDRRDRDLGLQQAKREWGADLFIPYAFATVETVLPRLLSNRPRMLVLPRDKIAEDNVQSVKATMDAQQSQIDYEMRLQTTGKQGLIVGLGVQKNYWKRVERKSKMVRPRRVKLMGMSDYVVKEAMERPFDDPFTESVDVYDFFWQPTAKNLEDAEYVIHRLWRSTDYCMAMLTSGQWDGCPGLTEEDVKAGGAPDRYGTVHRGRDLAAGGEAGTDWHGEQIHEVLEYHDGERVITILDNQWPVKAQDNYWHGEKAFSIYRPTEDPHGQLPGIGEVEAIEDLQIEMNVLRSQRRDNATLKLMETYAYADGAVDPDDLVFGPGYAIPVRGEPKDLLTPLTVGDIPNSGYQEEARLQADIERVSGIADAVSGGNQGGGVADTATGAQLVMAAANARIQLKTRRLEVELCKSDARQWHKLNQQMWRTRRDVRIPRVPQPGDDEPERRWAWLQVGPEEMAGEFLFDVEGGSTAPENVPQDRQDAQLMLTLLAPLQQYVDVRKVVQLSLEKLGIKNAEQYVAPDQTVPPATLDILFQELVKAGSDPQQAHSLIAAALDAARQGQEGDPQQVDQAMAQQHDQQQQEQAQGGQQAQGQQQAQGSGMVQGPPSERPGAVPTGGNGKGY